jgi:hypothetical protein
MPDLHCDDCGANYSGEDAHPDHPGLCPPCAGNHDATMGRAIAEAHGPRGWYADGSAEQEAAERRRRRG